MAMAVTAIPVPVMYPLTEVVSYSDLCQDLANSSATVCWYQGIKTSFLQQMSGRYGVEMSKERL